MRKPTDGEITFPFGATSDPYSATNPHAGVDYGAVLGANIYAPHGGTVTFSGDLGTCGLGVGIEAGRFKSRLCHNSTLLAGVGQTVTEGQVIARAGQSGQAFGVHSHWVLWDNGVRVAGNNYVTSQGVTTVFENDQQIQDMYYLLRGRTATATEVAGWRGKPIINFAQNQYAKLEVANREAYKASIESQLTDVKTALITEQNKPPKEIIKVVEKIVEKPVEVIKEVQVVPDEQTIVQNFFTRIWKNLFKKG